MKNLRTILAMEGLVKKAASGTLADKLMRARYDFSVNLLDHFLKTINAQDDMHTADDDLIRGGRYIDIRLHEPDAIVRITFTVGADDITEIEFDDLDGMSPLGMLKFDSKTSVGTIGKALVRQLRKLAYSGKLGDGL